MNLLKKLFGQNDRILDDKTMTDKCLIVGLGNPGREYALNRHNMGFQVVDRLAERNGISFSRLKFDAALASGSIAGCRCILAKPQTYMNNSGRAVRSIVDFYKIDLKKLLVIYDDMDLPTGTIRVRPEGGSGGQNGLKSVIQHLKTEQFARMRVGIGRPTGKMDPVGYVLQDFGQDEEALILETWERAASAIETWLRDGVTLAMSRHNGPAPDVK